MVLLQEDTAEPPKMMDGCLAGRTVTQEAAEPEDLCPLEMQPWL